MIYFNNRYCHLYPGYIAYIYTYTYAYNVWIKFVSPIDVISLARTNVIKNLESSIELENTIVKIITYAYHNHGVNNRPFAHSPNSEVENENNNNCNRFRVFSSYKELILRKSTLKTETPDQSNPYINYYRIFEFSQRDGQPPYEFYMYSKVQL